MEYKNIIIDSSVWIAYLSKKDSGYDKAITFEHLYLQEQVIPDIVFYEIITVLKNKKLPNIMNQFIAYATNETQITIRLFYEYNREVLKLFNSPMAEGLSYVDTLLLYLSRDYHILTFDDELKRRIKKFGGLLVK